MDGRGGDGLDFAFEGFEKEAFGGVVFAALVFGGRVADVL